MTLDIVSLVISLNRGGDHKGGIIARFISKITGRVSRHL